MRNLRIILLGFCLFGFVAGTLKADSPSLKTWVLGNGLKVYFVEKHEAPVVTVHVFYRAGGKDEPADKRGIAHMFEHMMFKGSKNVAPEEHARLIDAVGGNNNAYTQDDLTAYQNTVPPSALELALKLEAERMRNLELTQKTIDSEREVVKEELRVRLENSPVTKALDKILHLAYQKHPYQQFPIGEKKMLDTVTIEDCKKFYDMYYRPNNAVLIVVGDTDEAKVRSLVDSYFASLKPGPTPPRNKIVEPMQTQFREATLEMPVQIPIMIGAYHIPQSTSKDIFVLEVIQQILSGGDSSRLYKRLVVKEQLSIGAGGFVFNREDPGLFLTYAAYLPMKDATMIRKILEEEIYGLQKGDIHKNELQKAKNQLAARAVYAQETVDSIANQIGLDDVVSKNPLRLFETEKKYEAVTTADIQRVALKYFVPSNYSLVTLLPKMGEK